MPAILIVRTFIRLREIISTHKDLAARLKRLEAIQKRHGSVIRVLTEEIDNLNQLPPEAPKQRIGFIVDDTGS
jgi:hypothetical protein